MRVVVTGANGFVGRHLVRELVKAGHTVTGIGLGDAASELANLVADYVEADLVVGWPRVECDAVVHLAALSAVGPSFDRPQVYIESNSAPVTHLGEALLSRQWAPRVVVVSTGAVYGSDGRRALTETSPLVPTSPYAVSKILTEVQCDYYRRRGADLVVMRPFNHIGPGQGTGFVLPDLVEGVRRASANGAALTVGRLETRRDYTDVRDVVRAYRLAVEAPIMAVPVMNVCSGRSVAGHQLLAAVVDAMGVRLPEVEVDPARLRPDDPADIRGSNDLIRDQLGWVPEIPLGESVRDVVVSSEGAL